jgi:hypothetical protein
VPAPAAPAPAPGASAGPGPAPAPGPAPGSETRAGPGSAPGSEPGSEAAPAPGSGVGGLFEHMQCPITLALMVNPVTAADGRMYERTAIERVIKDHRRGRGRSRSLPLSPTTNEPLANDRLLPAVHVRQMIESAVKGGFLSSGVCEDWLERDAAAKAAKLEAIKTAALGGDAEACAQMMDAASANSDKKSWAYRGMFGTGPCAAKCSKFFGAFGCAVSLNEMDKMTLLALFTSADPEGENDPNAQARLAFIYSNEWKPAVRWARMALGKHPETRRRPPGQSRIDDKALEWMCKNIVATYDETPELKRPDHVGMMTSMYSFLRLWKVMDASKTLGLPPKTEDVPWHQSVTQEQAVAALERWRRLTERVLSDTQAYPYLNGQRIKLDFFYDLAWRVFVHEGGIRQCLPPGALDVIGRTVWPGLGIGDPTALTDDQLRAIAVSDFPSLPVKKCPPPSDDSALAEYLKAFRRYTEVGLMRTIEEGLVLPRCWRIVTYGPDGQPVGVLESSAAGSAAGPAAGS